MMYAIIRNGQGDYYTSLVFGYYRKITAVDDYQRYLEKIHNQWYVVLDKTKKRLIKQIVYPSKEKYLSPRILITDADVQTWQLDQDGCGSMDFLPTEKLLELIENNRVPDALTQKCIALDAKIEYQPIRTLQTKRDIENLEWVSGGFHDAVIEKIEWKGKILCVLFGGIWGCKIQLWLEGNVSFSLKSREDGDPYWMDSSLFKENGYIYLVDDCDMTAERITDDYCWFKAKSISYQVLPD